MTDTVKKETTEPEIDESRHYIKTHDFFNEQMKVLKTGEITPELGDMFMTLSSKYINHSHFNRYYHLKDDMIMEGVLACVRDCFKFRPNRNIIIRDKDGEIASSTPVVWDGQDIEYHHDANYSPLAFYTTTIRRAFIDVIKREYASRNIVNQLLIDNGLEADAGYLDAMKAKEAREKEEREKKVEDKSKRTAAIGWD